MQLGSDNEHHLSVQTASRGNGRMILNLSGSKRGGYCPTPHGYYKPGEHQWIYEECLPFLTHASEQCPGPCDSRSTSQHPLANIQYRSHATRKLVGDKGSLLLWGHSYYGKAFRGYYRFLNSHKINRNDAIKHVILQIMINSRITIAHTTNI